MIRWEDIQNLTTTEDEINQLSGLLASAVELNVLNGYTGTTSDLNDSIGLGTSFSNHELLDMVAAHTPVAGSLDGLIIAPGTISSDRLSFTIVTQTELDAVDAKVNSTIADLNVQTGRIDNLYGVVFPGQGNDIAAAIQQCIDHIEDVADAHDATAISYGETESGYYLLDTDTTLSTSAVIPSDAIRNFRVGDQIAFDDDVSIPETVTLSSVDYSTGDIDFTPALTTIYTVANNARVTNLAENNVQFAVDRSLKNNTDTFYGTLTINDAIHFSTGNITEDNGYTFNLSAGNSLDIVNGVDSNTSFSVDNSGNITGTTLSLNEYGTAFAGLLDKETLTADRTWVLPDRDGYIGVGDIAYTDLLKVSANNTSGEITISDGVKTNYDGEIIRAWISMESGSEFAAQTVDIATQLAADGMLATLGSSWIAFVAYIDTNDNLFYAYSTTDPIKQNAIDAIPFIPSVYMKLALIAVQGNGAGGIDNSTLEIIEDMRPFLNIGMTTVYYDESVEFPAGLAAFTPIPLPVNSRAGGINQKYNVGAGQLEAYVNDRFTEPVRDYTELAGSPIGQISYKYDLPADTVVRFRIEHHSAGAPSTGGGVGSTSLHNAYLTGPAIATDGVNGPVVITDGTSGANKALIINGDIEINGFIDPPTGYGFEPQTVEPGDLNANYHKLYVDINGELIYKKYNIATSVFRNLTKELTEVGTSQNDTFTNITGSTIPAYTPVALHPSTPGHIVVADVSSNTKFSRVIGLTTENILHNASGKVLTSGRLAGAGTGYSHADLLFCDPGTPGGKINETLLSLTQGNVSVIIGTVDGSDLLVNINRQGEFSN